VLAAGAATRFGRPKQVARFHGEPMVRLAARVALETCEAGVAVLTGAHAELVAAAVADLPITLVHHPGWRAGLGSTLRAAIDAAPACQGLLVLACDQPGVAPDGVAALAEAWRRDPERPAAASYADILGVPAILPLPAARRAEFPAERGAQAWLEAWAGGASAVALPAAADDVDTPEELAQLESGGNR
jgi:CTP:molybdopterin cytidylyltransferase MocA